jgi:hypothetical protein
LERIWAYLYAYVAFLPLIQKHGAGKPIDLTKEPEVQRARALLLWAHKAEKSGRYEPWPEHLPRPDKPDSSDPHIKTANQFFLMMTGWIFLHELAHIALGHRASNSLPSKESIQQEFEADRWASNWILAKWKDFDPDVRIFLQRCMGISFAIAALSGIELYVEGRTPRTHPNVADRLLRFFDDFIDGSSEEQKFVEKHWLAPISILQLHLMNSGKMTSLQKHYDNVREYLLDVRQYFPQSDLESEGSDLESRSTESND